MSTVTLFAPKVRYTSTFESQFDAMMTWRAELELSYLIEGDTPNVLAGHAEFLIIRVGEHPIHDLLDSLSQDAVQFADLFDGDDVADSIQDQFEDAPFNRILIITAIEVAAPLRGNDLGAWLAAEVIDRMASPTDTLVMLSPQPADPETRPTSERGVSTSSNYWRRVGLEPVEDHPQFMCQATAYSHLTRARAALSAVTDIEITVAASQIHEEIDDNPRHTVVGVADPQHLRLVRS